MDTTEDKILQSGLSDPSTLPDQTEISINTGDGPTTSDQPKEKPIWAKLENCLSGCLAVIILIALPFFFWYVILPLFEVEPDPNEKTWQEIRQEALDDNWEIFLERADSDGVILQIEKFDLALCPFTEEDNWNEDISPEEAGFICGNVTVPLDHLHPNGETIQIPIAIWPSYEDGTEPEPLVITHGGPGGSILEYAPRLLYPDRIGGKRDLVFIDQRGTQYAQPNLICPEVTADIYGSINPDYKRGEFDFQEELNYCRARLAGKGISLSAFNTPQIARDFEVVREILGYNQINFYGVSYGTHVGQYLAEYYPKSIRSLILDGVAPVPLDYLNRSVPTSTRILNELFTFCDQDPICSENYPELSNTLKAVIKRLDKNPEKVRLGFNYSFYPLELNGEFFYNYLLNIAYMDQNYAVLPYIIKEAEENRFDYFKAWVDWRISEISERSMAYYAVVCSEHQPFQLIDQRTPYLGFPIIRWERSDLKEFEGTCLELGIQDSPNTLRFLAESSIPTLLLSGNFDPITPPDYGEMTLESFTNGQHIIDPLGSHGILFSDECPDSILDQFLDDPHREVDSACLENPERREEVVPRTALSSLFMLKKKDIPARLIVYPCLMLIIAVPRYGIQGINWIWKKIKKTKINLAKGDKRLRVRFELTNWVFGLCSVGLGYGLGQFNTLLRRPDIYRYTLALPEDARLLMIIPLIIVLILPVLIFFSIRVWKHNASVLARVYLLLNTIIVLWIGGVIVFNDMLLTWTR